MVRVPVEDVNTQPPVLAQPSYTAYVLENKPRGHTVLTASASRNQRPRFSQPHYDIPIRENAADPEGNPRCNKLQKNITNFTSVQSPSVD